MFHKLKSPLMERCIENVGALIIVVTIQVEFRISAFTRTFVLKSLFSGKWEFCIIWRIFVYVLMGRIVKLENDNVSGTL